jgi:putative peptidoglycan binding protein
MLPGFHDAFAQATNATTQSAPSHPVINRSAPAARPVANTQLAPRIAPGPATVGPQVVKSYMPRTPVQYAPNVRPTYSVLTRSVNPSVATNEGPPVLIPDEQKPMTLDPAVRQNELRTLAIMRQRRSATGNRTLGPIDTDRLVAAHDAATRPSLDKNKSPADPARPKSQKKGDRLSYPDAFRRHWHEWHDRNWWHSHCEKIVFVTTGYYFLDGSYWYPAWGYDPLQSYYDYDGPVYTYSNLLPDEVIANVQVALQDAGYYVGAITGSLGIDLRAALANFQRDYGLSITGAIDEATVETLGLN